MKAAFFFSFCLLALQDPPAFPSRDELKIVVIHDDQAICSDYPKTFRCPDPKHWALSVNDVKSADRARIEAFIKSEAARFKTPDPKNPKVSELEIKILSESGAPYGEAESLMHQCALAGIYRVTLGEKKTEGKCETITSPLGVGTITGVDHQDLMIMIGKREPREHESVRWVDSAKLKDPLEDIAKYRRPRDEVTVLIDPIPSTPWTEVIRLLDALKAMGFERNEFAAPFKVGDAPKK
jgi:hypothetical protein